MYWLTVDLLDHVAFLQAALRGGAVRINIRHHDARGYRYTQLPRGLCVQIFNGDTRKNLARFLIAAFAAISAISVTISLSFFLRQFAQADSYGTSVAVADHFQVHI